MKRIKILVDNPNHKLFNQSFYLMHGDDDTHYPIQLPDQLIFVSKDDASVIFKPWEAAKAVEEGMAIDIWNPDVNKWASCNKKTRIVDLNCLYRLAPLPEKPKYIPFNWENWETFTKKPVTEKGSKVFFLVNKFMMGHIYVADVLYTYTEAFEKLEFIDGTPFGKLIPNE